MNKNYYVYQSISYFTSQKQIAIQNEIPKNNLKFILIVY